MKTHRFAALAAVSTLVAIPAAALDFGNGFSLVGDVELEYFDPDGGSDRGFGFTDLTFGWRGQGGGAVSLGFDLGLESRHDFDNGDAESVFWGGLVVGTGFGEITVGNPRPLLDQLPQVPDVGSVRAIREEVDFLTGSAQSALLLSSSSLNAYGISLKGGNGGLTYGASVHRLEDGGDATNVLELMAMYEYDRGAFYAGYETFDEDSLDLEKLIVGGQFSAQRWAAGLEIARLDTESDNEDIFTLYGDYKPTEALSIGVQVLDFDTADSTLYGINGRFGMANGAFAELGAYTSDGSGDDAISASIGYEF